MEFERNQFADGFEEDESEAAAREAAAIGGVAGDEGIDPAERPVREAGGGQAEGWEQAEADLIRNASHGDDRSDTVVISGAGRTEAEGDGETGTFGEADGVHPSDPNAGSSTETQSD